MLPWRLQTHNPQWPKEIDPGKWQQKDPRLDDGCHLLALELLQIAPEKQQKDWNMTTNQILGSTTHLVTVTTRSITSLVGNPYKPLFATGILSVGTSKQFPYQSQSIIQDFRFSQKKRQLQLCQLIQLLKSCSTFCWSAWRHIGTAVPSFCCKWWMDPSSSALLLFFHPPTFGWAAYPACKCSGSVSNKKQFHVDKFL